MLLLTEVAHCSVRASKHLLWSNRNQAVVSQEPPLTRNATGLAVGRRPLCATQLPCCPFHPDLFFFFFVFFVLQETVLTGKMWLYSRAIPAILACYSHPPQGEQGREDLLNIVPGQDGVGSSRSWRWSGSKIISPFKATE